MKIKIFSAVVFSLFCADAVQSMQIVNNIKQDINTEFRRSADAVVMIVTVERGGIEEIWSESSSISDRQRSDNRSVGLGRFCVSEDYNPLISHEEFEQILRLLYGVCTNVRTESAWYFRRNCIPNYTREGIVLGEDLVITQKERDDIESVRREIKPIFFSGNNVKNTSKLVVFGESFFSGTIALDEIQKHFIESKLLALSTSSPHSILYPNFLYTKFIQKKGTEVYADLLAMGKHAGEDGLDIIRNCVQRFIPNWGEGERAENSSVRFRDMSVLERCAESIASNVPNDESLVAQEYLFNETYAICGGEILTRTVKSGYQSDCDYKLIQGCLYAAGSGNTEAVPVSSDKRNLQNILLRGVSVDLDLKFTPSLLNRVNCRVIVKDSRLHVLQLHNLQQDASRPLSKSYLPYIGEDGSYTDLAGCSSSVISEFSENTHKFTFLKI